jgi:hypothetical protein
MKKRYSLWVCAIASGILVGCGGGTGNKTGSGGSSSQGGATSATGGSFTNGGGAGGGGTGGSSVVGGPGGSRAAGGAPATGAGGAAGSTATDAGAKGSGGSPGKADAAADQTSAKADGPIAGGSCPAFVPCGGDIVGTWNLVSECLSGQTATGNCGVSMTATASSGYWMRYVFNADGTFSSSVAGKLDSTTRYSAGCLGDASTPAQACANLQQAIAQEFGGILDAAQSSFTLEKLECAMQADACVCEEVGNRPESTINGTYTVAGNQLFIAMPSVPGDPEPIDYCVSGNTFTQPTTSGDGYVTFTR